jgi:hypothetical protein
VIYGGRRSGTEVVLLQLTKGSHTKSNCCRLYKLHLAIRPAIDRELRIRLIGPVQVLHQVSQWNASFLPVFSEKKVLEVCGNNSKRSNFGLENTIYRKAKARESVYNESLRISAISRAGIGQDR